eukprot:scaffold58451_cov70-Phaeocystis_antarctica.AAC.4
MPSDAAGVPTLGMPSVAAGVLPNLRTDSAEATLTRVGHACSSGRRPNAAADALRWHAQLQDVQVFNDLTNSACICTYLVCARAPWRSPYGACQLTAHVARTLKKCSSELKFGMSWWTKAFFSTPWSGLGLGLVLGLGLGLGLGFLRVRVGVPFSTMVTS